MVRKGTLILRSLMAWVGTASSLISSLLPYQQCVLCFFCDFREPGCTAEKKLQVVVFCLLLLSLSYLGPKNSIGPLFKIWDFYLHTVLGCRSRDMRNALVFYARLMTSGIRRNRLAGGGSHLEFCCKEKLATSY